MHVDFVDQYGIKKVHVQLDDKNFEITDFFEEYIYKRIFDVYLINNFCLVQKQVIQEILRHI